MARTAWWSWIVQFWILDILLWYIGSICCGNALLSPLGRNNPAELFLGAVFIESSSQVHVKDTHQRQDKHELLYPWREGATTPIIGANLKLHNVAVPWGCVLVLGSFGALPMTKKRRCQSLACRRVNHHGMPMDQRQAGHFYYRTRSIVWPVPTST